MDVIRDALADLGIDIAPASRPADDLRRQDRSADRSEKVANWQPFLSDMERMGALDEIECFDLTTSPLIIEAQIALETVLPRGPLRWLARGVGMSGMPRSERG